MMTIELNFSSLMDTCNRVKEWYHWTRVAWGPSGVYTMGVGVVGDFPICFPYYFSDVG